MKNWKFGNLFALVIPLFVILFVFYGLTLPPGIIQSVSYKALLGLFACLLLWSTLRIMDLISGINFKEWWKTNESSQGLYLACRMLAYAIVFCFVFAFA